MASSKIVVGVDESAGSAEALQWAVAEARLRDADVVAVLAWGFLDQHQISGVDFDPSYAEGDARKALDEFVARAVGDEAASHVMSMPICDLPVPALLEASAGADLLVVGARGLGGFKGLLLGSVSQRCLHHTEIPIAVVRNVRAQGSSLGRVVVGVDNSSEARRALRWAIDEAARRGAQLDVVTAWEVPVVGGMPIATAALDPEVSEQAAVDRLARAVRDEDTSSVTGTIRRIAVQGGPSSVLISRAEGADLLVVGSRGHGALGRMLVGSVATQLSHHAPCPLVVVPPPPSGS
ncbi:MAG TPA: universal stress protein [Acidimicrobiales bacterium]|nr:universal stress protein [Acidimicrobiales bacterium]